MKKTVIAAAIVAAVGLSAYLGFRPDPASSLTELQLANAEALTDVELDPVDVVCNVSGTGGICHFQDITKGIINCGLWWFYECSFNGIPQSKCPTC
ncbi:MAG: hypothetical protein HDS02_04960 [Bacteroides sp.]|nr:hypothetical protein [Bacteroides sp.]